MNWRLFLKVVSSLLSRSISALENSLNLLVNSLKAESSYLLNSCLLCDWLTAARLDFAMLLFLKLPWYERLISEFGGRKLFGRLFWLVYSFDVNTDAVDGFEGELLLAPDVDGLLVKVQDLEVVLDVASATELQNFL
jgi:hypothetical protein